MRICYVTNLYGENARGGAERIVAAEVDAMVTAGHEVTVIAGAAPAFRQAGYRQSDDASEGADVVRVVPWNLYPYADGRQHSLILRFFWHLIDMAHMGAAREVGVLVDRLSPDVVHTHNLMGLGFRIPRALRRRGVRHVHTVHDVQLLHPSGLLTEARPGVFPRLSRWVYRTLMRTLMGSPETVIFPSRYLADLHDRYGFFPESEKVVLSNPAPDVTGPHPRMSEVRFLFVGQLEEHKGIIRLVDTWRTSAIEGAVLVIVGTGTLEGDVRHRIGERGDIVMRGRLDMAQVNAEYDRATFVVVPSLVMENQPTVILEAFSRGVPVIATDIGGIPELVAEGQTGFLFDVGDPTGLAEAIARAHARMSGWSLMSERVRDRVRLAGTVPHREALEDIYRRRTREVGNDKRKH